MSVSDGQRADAENFNNAFMSRTTNTSTVGEVALNNPSSGGTIANAQQAINDNATNIASNDVDISTLQATKENIADKGVANGYCPLDATGKVDPSFLPTDIVNIKGNWDASTNTPTLADGVGDDGDVYIVNVAGTQDLGSGNITFAVGDWAFYNAGVWIKVINSNTVTSVNGQSGIVVLNINDINDVNTGSPGAADDQKAIIWDNTAGEYVLGTVAGSGQGGINYVINNGAETTADDHVAYKDAVQDTPEDGDGGSPTLSVVRTVIAGDILRGVASFAISKPGANVQGEGIRVNTNPIDPRDKFSRIQVSFDYKHTNPGSNNYADGDLRVFVYDVDNATLLGAVENGDNGDILRHEGDGATFIGYFTATDSLNYRLLFHQTNATTDSAATIYDNVKVSPIEGNLFTNMSDWQAYTPTFDGYGTVSNVQFFWRRSGDSLYVKGRFQAGSTSATTGAISLPPGLVVSLTNITSEYNSGYMTRGAASSANIVYGIFEDAGTEINFSARGSANPQVRGTGLQHLDTGEIGVVEVGPIPIEGWISTNVVNNNELTQLSPYVVASGNAGESLTADVTNIPFIESLDPLGNWSGDSYQAPRDGIYSFEGAVNFNASISTNLVTYIDGAVDKLVGTVGPVQSVKQFKWSGFLAKDQVLSIRSTAGATLSNSTVNHWMTITADPQLTTYGVINPNQTFVEALDTTNANIVSPNLDQFYVPVPGWTVPIQAGTHDLYVQGFLQATTTTTSAVIRSQVQLSTSLTPGAGLIGQPYQLGLYQQGSRAAEGLGFAFHLKEYTTTVAQNIYVHVVGRSWSGATNLGTLAIRNDTSGGVLSARKVR